MQYTEAIQMKKMSARGIYRLSLVIILVTMTACSTHEIKLINPQTGATAQCNASGYGLGASLGEGFAGGCSRSYEDRGYVRLDRLTPDERASLERRGLLPKD
jgi:hypothetical protein